MKASAPVSKDFLCALSDRLGLGFAMQRYAVVEPAIRDKVRRSGRDPDAFLTDLDRDSNLLQDAIETVVVPETHFFRHPQHFAFLRDEVMPQLMHGDGPIRVWSAGCSTGEEAYSLAIMLHQLGLSGRAEIRATDISVAALKKAQRAVYRRWSLRGVEEWPGASRYFQRLAGGEYRLAPEAANLVTFGQLNLATTMTSGTGPGAASMDVILCRNVLIYMTTEAAAGIVRRLLETLAPTGWLVPGPSDPVSCRSLGYPVVTPNGIFYRRSVRVEGTAAAAASQRPSLRAEAPHGPAHSSHRQGRVVARIAPADEPAAAPRRRHVARGTPGTAGLGAVPARERPSVAAPQQGRPAPRHEPLQATLQDVGRLMNAGRTEEASSLAQAAVERAPLCPEVHFMIAFVHWHLGRLELALASIGKAIYLNPQSAAAHQMQGLLLVEHGRAERARQAFLTAYRLASRLPNDALVELGGGATAIQLARAARQQLRCLQQPGGVS